MIGLEGDAWSPGETAFFTPDWSAWPRGNGNTLIQDINAHINNGSGWFAVEFDCFNCTDRPNLRFPPPYDANSWSIVMEVETAVPLELVAEKNYGLCPSCPVCANCSDPINFATGNKYEIETDISLSGPGLPLKYTRYYNSQSSVNNDASGAGRLTLIADRNGNTQTLLYDANDRLHSVSDNFGRSLTFAYNTNGRIQTLTTPIGSFTYVYTNGNLTKVIHPDTKFRQHRYEDPNDAHNLTGIINENGVQYVTFAYDDQDRAVSSKNIGDL